MSKNLVLTILFSIFVLTANLSKAQDNVAFIDLNIVFDNSNAGKAINKNVASQKKKNDKNFRDLKKKFDAEREKLKAQKNVISEEEYKKKFIELENNLKEYNLKINKENQDLTKYQLKARKKFFDNLRPILENYAKENSIDMILKKENVLIGKTSLDISKDILEIFDKTVKKITVE